MKSCNSCLHAVLLGADSHQHLRHRPGFFHQAHPTSGLDLGDTSSGRQHGRRAAEITTCAQFYGGRTSSTARRDAEGPAAVTRRVRRTRPDRRATGSAEDAGGHRRVDAGDLAGDDLARPASMNDTRLALSSSIPLAPAPGCALWPRGSMCGCARQTSMTVAAAGFPGRAHADVGGCGMAYVDGRPGGPLGAGRATASSSRDLVWTATRAADAGTAVIATDMIGFAGRTSLETVIIFARHVEWTRACAFDALGLDRRTLVGQDWGGLRLAGGQYLDLVRAVVAVNTGPPTGDAGDARGVAVVPVTSWRSTGWAPLVQAGANRAAAPGARAHQRLLPDEQPQGRCPGDAHAGPDDDHRLRRPTGRPGSSRPWRAVPRRVQRLDPTTGAAASIPKRTRRARWWITPSSRGAATSCRRMAERLYLIVPSIRATSSWADRPHRAWWPWTIPPTVVAGARHPQGR